MVVDKNRDLICSVCYDEPVDVQKDLAEILAINCLPCGVFVGNVAHKMLYSSIENLVL